jgi:hypothetical protein
MPASDPPSGPELPVTKVSLIRRSGVPFRVNGLYRFYGGSEVVKLR